MDIVVVGAGYVGLVAAASFASLGCRVYCVENNENKLKQLETDTIDIYEDGLQELIQQGIRDGRLSFHPKLSDVLQSAQMIFLCLPTPSVKHGIADLSSLLHVCEELGAAIEQDTLVVVKSTVPAGTTARLERVIRDAAARHGRQVDFDIAMNPEFLRQGCAVQDFLHPHSVVIGARDNRAADRLARLYASCLHNPVIQIMSPVEAEMAKYASNYLLASRVSIINELANLCEAVGADIASVRNVVGLDPNIGNGFLNAGIGYGGSCFPKDIEALIKTANTYGLDVPIMRAVQSVNDRQKQRLVAHIIRRFGNDLAGYRFAVWGLAFKPGTDDMREAPSLDVIHALSALGASISAYDPAARRKAQMLLEGTSVEMAADKYEAVLHADALLILTEWEEFYEPDLAQLKERMRQPLIYDGRRVLKNAQCRTSRVELIQIGAGRDHD
ncbi:UDP-glucose dehydrogenase family protein [Paenibacillus xanthanilyticus]|uniref:UDP-glucose 6-dehydrogenase n=1 Tax=Paenibacillus xanthanilyticus TaxID=1783531 RepID=A0ABV8K214_9BACL